MNASEQHPARSADFLSRLHDGDLDAAERARFEAHRAHCSECRDAAAQFEDALAFFRSSRPRPPAPDLASRILRSLRASTPRRAPLGRAFGIDLKWAGAFATALIAVIIGSTVILERERRDARLLREPSIPVSIATRADSPPPAAPKRSVAPPAEAPTRTEIGRAEARRHSDALAGLAASERKQLPADREETDALTKKRASVAPSNEPFAPAPQSAPPAAVAAAPAPAASAAREEAAKPKVLDKSENEERAGSLGARQRVELQGGEGGQQQQKTASSTVTVAKEPAIRIQVLAPDGEGFAPVPSNAAELSLSASDRGEYVVVVRSDGTVASVRESGPESDAQKVDKSKDDKLKEARRPALDELKKLRFAPAARQRNLVLKVE